MIKNTEIANFENRLEKLKQEQYNSLHLELKRSFTIKKRIKITIQDFRPLFLTISKIKEEPVEGGFVKINKQLTRILNFNQSEISFVQLYKEFYVTTEIILQKKKMVFVNRFFHLFALTGDSLKSKIIKRYLKREFKSRFKKIKKLVKAV